MRSIKKVMQWLNKSMNDFCLSSTAQTRGQIKLDCEHIFAILWEVLFFRELKF